MRPKKKNKKATQAGEQCITDHFEAQQTTQPKTAPMTTAATEDTTRAKAALTPTKITSYFLNNRTKNIDTEENNEMNKISKSNKNACNAHPPKGKEDRIVTEDSMEIRRGIGQIDMYRPVSHNNMCLPHANKISL